MATDSNRIYVVDTLRSVITIATKSAVHGIHGTGSGITGEMSASFKDGSLDRDSSVHMKIAIPVGKLSSGNLAQDEKMHALVSSRTYPNVEASLTNAVPSDTAQRYRVSGTVTINGMERLFSGDMTIAERDGRVEIAGERDFDIRMWRIEPPKFLGFSIDPSVHVELKLFADLKVV